MKHLNLNILALFVFLGTFSIAQDSTLVPIETIKDSAAFCNILKQIESETDALYVFDIDNTILVTNENGFGSDWWYAQTKKNPDLKLNVSNTCLFDVLTPLFYAMFDTKCLFRTQAKEIDALGTGKSRTIALTSRAYSPVVATATEIELQKNQYTFLKKESKELAPAVIMHNSVIYTRGQNKGIILLDYIKNNPYEKIYYFDDSWHKVEDVQEAFSGSRFDIAIYHMEVAPKIPYTKSEIEYMQEKLCNLIKAINSQGGTACKCEKKD